MSVEIEPNQIRLIVLSGLPGAGKSTAARNLSFIYDAHVVVRDDFRKLFDDISEIDLTLYLVQFVDSYLRIGTSVVVDACNLSPWDFNLWMKLAKDTNVTIEWVHLDATIDECVCRDAARLNPMGSAVIYAMADELSPRFIEKLKALAGKPLASVH